MSGNEWEDDDIDDDFDPTYPVVPVAGTTPVTAKGGSAGGVPTTPLIVAGVSVTILAALGRWLLTRGKKKQPVAKLTTRGSTKKTKSGGSKSGSKGKAVSAGASTSAEPETVVRKAAGLPALSRPKGKPISRATSAATPDRATRAASIPADSKAGPSSARSPAAAASPASKPAPASAPAKPAAAPASTTAKPAAMPAAAAARPAPPASAPAPAASRAAPPASAPASAAASAAPPAASTSVAPSTATPPAAAPAAAAPPSKAPDAPAAGADAAPTSPTRIAKASAAPALPELAYEAKPFIPAATRSASSNNNSASTSPSAATSQLADDAAAAKPSAPAAPSYAAMASRAAAADAAPAASASSSAEGKAVSRSGSPGSPSSAKSVGSKGDDAKGGDAKGDAAADAVKPLSYAAALGKAEASKAAAAAAADGKGPTPDGKGPASPKASDSKAGEGKAGESKAAPATSKMAMSFNANAAPFVPPARGASEAAAAGGESSGRAAEEGQGNGDAASGEESAAVVQEAADAEGDVFEHRAVELQGRDIPADAEMTADEVAADTRLASIARRLQAASGTMNQQAIVQRGVKDMLENVKFCQEHEIRPARFAEHASTASDFFFQVNAFREAEETLDGAIQAAVMAENWDLEATLINNMGTVLRKQRKFHATVSLHEKQLEGVVEKHGLHSPYVVLARHNLVEAYECLQRVGDAEALLTQQLAAMEAGPAEESTTAVEEASTSEETKTASIAVPSADSVAATEEGAAAEEASAEEPDAASKALMGRARCHLDLARFMHRQDRLDEAVVQARLAHGLAVQAMGEYDPATAVYTSFYGSMLKLLAEQNEDQEPLREARDHFMALVQMAEQTEGGARNLPALYRTLAEIALGLEEPQAAFEFGQKMIHIMALLSGGNQYHPSLRPFWNFVESLHTMGGDPDGAAQARRAALKCKITAKTGRDSGHKKRQTSRRNNSSAEQR